jgi:hypothetical protein
MMIPDSWRLFKLLYSQKVATSWWKHFKLLTNWSEQKHLHQRLYYKIEKDTLSFLQNMLRRNCYLVQWSFFFLSFFFEMRTYIDHLISDFKPRPCIHVEGILCTYPTTHLLICICMWLYFSLLICPKKFMNWSAQLDLVNNQSLCYKVDENTNNTVEMQTL